MKINIILPNVKLTGGVRMVFQYANFLSEQGHEVICYYPKVGSHVGRLKFVKNLYQLLFIKPESDGKWFHAKFKLENPVSINERSIHDGDVVIATAWITVLWVQRLSNRKGKKVYFIQDFETWGNERINKMVIDTYDKTIWDKAISVSTALHNRLIQETGLDTEVICNGIPQSEISTSYKKAHGGTVVIGFPYREEGHKNCNQAIKILFDILKGNTKVQVVSYGLERPENWPDVFEFITNPTREQLFDFYEKTDIFYVPSLYEGWGLPVVEAMGHGCVVLAGNSGAIAEFGIDNQNCVIIKDPTDQQEIHQKIEDLISSEKDRIRIGQNAWELVKDKYSFDEQAKNFEDVLLQLN